MEDKRVVNSDSVRKSLTEIVILYANFMIRGMTSG